MCLILTRFAWVFLEDRYERVVKAAVNSGVCMHVFHLMWRLAPPVHDSLCRCDLLELETTRESWCVLAW